MCLFETKGLKWEIPIIFHNKLNKPEFFNIYFHYNTCFTYIQQTPWHVYHGKTLSTFTLKKLTSYLAEKRVSLSWCAVFVYTQYYKSQFTVTCDHLIRYEGFVQVTKKCVRVLFKWPTKCMRVGRSLCWKLDMQRPFYNLLLMDVTWLYLAAWLNETKNNLIYIHVYIRFFWTMQAMRAL